MMEMSRPYTLEEGAYLRCGVVTGEERYVLIFFLWKYIINSYIIKM